MNQETKLRKPILRPLKVQCSYEEIFEGMLISKCSKTFEVKYHRGLGEYVKRNNWGYWTEKEEDKEKYICNPCLISLYKEHKYIFLENVTSQKKRSILRTYYHGNSLVKNPKLKT